MAPQRLRPVFLAVAAALAAVTVVSLPRPSRGSGSPAAPSPVPPEEGPPTLPEYRQALRLGLEGNVAAAGAAMESLARSHPGTNLGAWSLYQASLAARSTGDAAGADRLLETLHREYPGHRLSLRTGAASPAGAGSRVAVADCGPRALQHLCRQAGRPADLQELRERCGTGPDGTTLEGLGRGAAACGFRQLAAQVDAWYLRRRRPTGIARVDGDHFVSFRPGRSAEKLLVFDPNEDAEREVPAEGLVRRCQGIVLLLTP